MSPADLSADAVLTLDHLPLWSFPGTALAVLGHPIKHSISPAMHNAALGEMMRTERDFHDWRYFRFDVPPERLPEALTRLHAAGFFGLNLTVPHKVLAFERIQEIDPAARPIGAVNTLRRSGAGWRGFNTDGYGLASALREDLGVDLAGAKIILLGAGGAARGAAVECLEAGCASLAVGNRTQATLDELLASLAPLARRSTVRGFDLAHPPSDLPTNAIVINATSLGLKPEDPAPIDLAKISRPAAVFDMIYRPAETALLRQAGERGIARANGLGMLVHQGARSLAIWTGAPVPVEAMQRAARSALATP